MINDGQNWLGGGKELSTISFRLFLFILAFAPLAFGTSEHWSMMTVQIVTVISFFFCLGGLTTSSDPLYRIPGLTPLFLLLGFIGLQFIPLPSQIVQVISPASWEAYRPVYDLSQSNRWIPITVNQKVTLQELLRIGGYVLFYVLTVHILSNRKKLRTTLHFLAVLVSCVAFMAILQQFSSEGKIYWLRSVSSQNPGGPWVNINQYAAFVAAFCPLILALFFYYKPMGGDTTFREHLVTLFSSQESNRHILLGGSFILLVLSVFISLCRGGIMAACGAMIIFALLAGYKKKNFTKATVWVALLGALLAITWIGWQPVLDELDKTFTQDGTISDVRFQLWDDTTSVIKDFIYTGSGFGTYKDVYPSYKTIANNLIYDHAHNDYLELLTDGGIIGFCLATWFCMSVLSYGLRNIRIRRDRFAVLLGIGSITSIITLLAHSTVDFNFHNGAIGLYFFFLCGFLVAVTSNRYSFYGYASLLHEGGRKEKYFLIIFSVVFFLCVSIVQGTILVAANNFTEVSKVYVTSHLAADKLSSINDKLNLVERLDPLEGLYPFYRGNVSVLKEGREEAAVHYIEAAQKQPMEGIYLQRLAMMMPEEYFEKAAAFMSEGYRRTLNKESYIFTWAEWLLVHDKRNNALDILHERFIIDPAQFKEFIPLLETYNFSILEIEAVIPNRVGAWVQYGNYLEKSGNIVQSRYFRTKALGVIDYEPDVKAAWFNQLIRFYLRHKQPEKALEVVRFGIEKVPDYAPFHVRLGDYYRNEGISYRAKEEYQRAAMLDPGNAAYRKKLRKVKLDIEFGQ